MLIEIIKIGVSTGGKDIRIGEQREVEEASAKSLIADGYAEEVKETVAENALKSSTGEKKSQDDKVPDQDGKTGADGQAGANDGAGNGTGTEDEVDKVKKALDAQYKRDDLYEAAKAAGVEIAFAAKKADIIDAVILQGKTAALLKS